jgi:protein-S-isoprenylcysteine O-methyltransferase Ste14
MKMIDIPPVWLAGFAVLAWLQPRLIPAGPPAGNTALWAGGALVGLGLALMAAALWAFMRARTTPIPHQEPTALIASGIFRFTRNPIYLGDALVLAGLCIRWGAWTALLLVPLFILLIDRRFIRAEEARLARAFGPDFEAYAARTRRWL